MRKLIKLYSLESVTRLSKSAQLGELADLGPVSSNTSIMKILLFWRVVCATICVSFIFSEGVISAPIAIDFNTCNTAFYPALFPNTTALSLQCCPIKPTKPIIDGMPPLTTSYTRVRKAAQCTDAAYAEQLNKAYSLMRALPDDDPRSFTQQWAIHCAYCGGSVINTNNSGIPEGIDIHFSWLFYPWHRYYLYFHERILQSLLGDPDFSLSYWNWDSPYSLGDQQSKDGACLKQGHNFPVIYQDPSTGQFDVNRSDSAKGYGPLHFPDFTSNLFVPEAQEPPYNATEEQVIENNLNIMYGNLVSMGTTAETFLGRPIRAGDSRGESGASGGGGSLESGAHAFVHVWTGRDGPISVDMGILAYSARDPSFFSHHGNMDRMFAVWKDIGPILGQDRKYYSDPDFLDATFLFYDENKDLRRVRIGDSLDLRNFGYEYQKSNIAPWLFINQTSCSKLNYSELVAQAESLPVPTQDSSGHFHLQAGTPFVLVIERPDNPHGLEEFLTIDGIQLDRSNDAGFNVFVDLLDPFSYPMPMTCAEYCGRFTNMASRGTRQLMWKQSITRTLVDIQAPSAPSKLVITIVPLSAPGGCETIKFKFITVDTSTI